jgi:ABC-2 type transport system permease protein
MNRIKAILFKDLKLFFGDRKAMLITFLVPIGIASFFGSIFGNTANGPSTSKKIPILVVDNDGSPLVRKVIEGLKKDSMADPTETDEASATESVKQGKRAVAVIFPKGFGENAPKAMFNGVAPVVELRYDPSKNMEMQAVQGSIMQVAMQKVTQSAFSANTDYSSQMKDIDSSPGLTADQKKSFHSFFDSLKGIQKVNSGTTSQEGGGMRQPFTLKAEAQTAVKKDGDDLQDYSQVAHSFAGMAMQGVLFYGINAAMTILRERRQGIWKRLRASPVTLPEMLIGKGLSTALIGAVVLGGVIGFGMLAFGIRVSGSWLGLGLVLLASAAMTSAFGLLVASLGRTEEQSRGLSIMAVLLMVMLGGAWFPNFLMPEWVQKLSLIVPVRWALDGLDSMLWRGGSFGAALTPVAGLLVFTLIFGAIASFRFSTMPETS